MPVSYSIKINFATNKKAPERVFHAMALYIEGFNELQSAFLRGYSEDISTTSSLEGIRADGCIADIYHKVKNQKHDCELPELFSALHNALTQQIGLLAQLDCAETIQRFIAEVYQHAETFFTDTTFAGTADSAQQVQANPLLVSDALHKIDKAKKYLSGKDTVALSDAQGEFFVLSDAFSCPRNGEKIFSHSEIKLAEQLLIIKKAAYEQGVKWEFICPLSHKTQLAHLSDKQWFSQWQQQTLQLSPGDALLVNVKSKIKTNAIKHVVRAVECDIIEVLAVIKAADVEAELSQRGLSH